MRTWKGIVIHHSASNDVSADTIRKWHTSEPRNWKDIGYHYVIRKDGLVELGRNLETTGAHALYPEPSRNHTHIGICVTGRFSHTPISVPYPYSPSYEQIASLTRLVLNLVIGRLFGDLVPSIERHHDTCPGWRFPLEDLIAAWEYELP